MNYLIILSSTVTDIVAGISIGLIVLIVIFLVARELTCWYWKTNKILSEIEELKNLVRNKSGDSQHTTYYDKTKDMELCPFCKEKSSTEKNVCEHCGKRKH